MDALSHLGGSPPRVTNANRIFDGTKSAQGMDALNCKKCSSHKDHFAHTHSISQPNPKICDGGINPRSLAGQTRTIGSPAGSPGHETRWPTNRRGKLPSLLRQRVREPGLPGHAAAPRPNAPGQSHADDPGRALQERRAS